MELYTIYCTEEQTKKALELGAPIGKKIIAYSICTQPSSEYEEDFSEETDELIIPTAEQMTQWLEEQGFDFLNSRYSTILENLDKEEVNVYEGTRKKSTLAAIDAALDYLSKNKK